MYRAFKYRIYPTKAQEWRLKECLEAHRLLYNEGIRKRHDAWAHEKKSLKFSDQAKWFTSESKINPAYGKLNAQSAQATLRMVERTFEAFFNGSKYPRYKPHGQFHSFRYVQVSNGWSFKDNRLRLQHIPKRIKVKMHRPMEGKIANVVIHFKADRWHVIFLCDVGNDDVPKSVNPPIGIDVGVKSFIATSDGALVKNPKFYETTLPALRRAQRSLRRKKKGGRNREKARKKVARIHVKVVNQRRSFHFKVAHELCQKYGFIAAEEFGIKPLLKSGSRMSRLIQDSAWWSFLEVLAHVASKRGVGFVKVNARGTTQQCSGCGKCVAKTLSDRVHGCTHCGLRVDRDVNAARNVLARARLAPADGNVEVVISRRQESPPQYGHWTAAVSGANQTLGEVLNLPKSK